MDTVQCALNRLGSWLEKLEALERLEESKKKGGRSDLLLDAIRKANSEYRQAIEDLRKQGKKLAREYEEQRKASSTETKP